MIKPSSINGVAKKAALGAMLAGSVAMFATNPNKTARVENPPQQTEVVSKDGAEALKVMAFPQQQTPAVPTVHNKAIDEKFLKLASNDEEKRFFENYLLDIYNNCGSYLASAKIQQSLDLNIFLQFLSGNIDFLKRFDEEAYNKIDRDAMQKVTEKSEPIIEWLNENYWNVYHEPLGKFDHRPDYEELDKSLTDYMIKDPYNIFDDAIEGFMIGKMNEYNKLLKKSNIDELTKKSYLIAFKTSIADYMLFFNLLENAGIYRDYRDSEVNKNLKIFRDAVAPNEEWAHSK